MAMNTCATRCPSDLSVEHLEVELTSWAGRLASAECRWLRLVAEYDRREAWRGWECHSCAHWSMWQCGLDLRSAREKVRVARALEGLPLVARSFEEGRLSCSKVRAVTRIATPEIEAALVEIARSTHTSALERIVAGYRRADVRHRTDDEAVFARRTCTWFDEDGSYVLAARLPADEGALVVNAIHACTDGGTGDDRSAEQRRADALVVVASRALGGASNGSAEHFQVVVHTDADVISGRAPGRAHLDDGAAVSAATVQRLACDGTVVEVVHPPGGSPSAGPRVRAVPAATRRAVHIRDRGCRFPGCSHRVWIDAHHVEHWANGGPTVSENLISLCRHHHRAVHEGGWSVHLDADGHATFIRPDGAAVPDPSWPARSFPAADLDVEVEPDAIVGERSGDAIHVPYVVSVLRDAAHPPEGRFS